MDIAHDIDELRERMYRDKYINEIKFLERDENKNEWSDGRIEALNSILEPPTDKQDTKWKKYVIKEKKYVIDIYVKGSSMYYFSNDLNTDTKKDISEVVANFKSGKLFETGKLKEEDAEELSSSDKVVKYLESI